MMGFGLLIPIVVVVALAYAFGWPPHNEQSSQQEKHKRSALTALDILDQRYARVTSAARNTSRCVTISAADSIGVPSRWGTPVFLHTVLRTLFEIAFQGISGFDGGKSTKQIAFGSSN
jgi:hypothetical protein